MFKDREQRRMERKRGRILNGKEWREREEWF